MKLSDFSFKSLFKIFPFSCKCVMIAKKEVEKNMHSYPSDISREQFEIIREDLESAKKRTRPRKTDLYDVFCAILYLLKGGIQWRMLPSDFPDWRSVYYYFRLWSKEDESGTSILDQVLKKINLHIPQSVPQKEQPFPRDH